MPEFHTTSFPKDPAVYMSPTWEDMNLLAFQISQQITAKEQKQFDRIITLAKGGWPMTRSLVDFLSIPKVASIGVKFYCGIAERLEQPEIYQDIPISVSGETVLLFDDVADTGESLIFTKDYLKTRGVKRVSTATLFYKPHSKYKPDYYGAETPAWIVFPYEIFEAMEMLSHKWTQLGVKPKEIRKRFEKMRFPEEYLEAASIT